MLLSILMSCNRQAQEQNETFETIALSIDSSEAFRYSKYLENPVFIPLETNPNSLIGHVTKVDITDEYIIILDKNIAKSLFLFNREGKFLRKIGISGRGPGEYSTIIDFYFNQDTETIQICDFKKIYTYDLKGNFVSTLNIKEDISVNGFTALSNKDEYIFSSLIFDNILIYCDGKISGFLPKPKSIEMNAYYPSEYMISNYKGEILAYVPFSPIIYQVKDCDIHPYYYFDYGKNNLPENYFDNHNWDNYEKDIYDKEYAYSLRNFSHTNDYLFIGTRQGLRTFTSLISRKSNQPITSYFQIYDDLTFCYPRPHKIFGENKMLAVKEADSFSNYHRVIAKSDSSPDREMLNRLEELEKQVKQGDNPILVIYDIKSQDE